MTFVQLIEHDNYRVTWWKWHTVLLITLVSHRRCLPVAMLLLYEGVCLTRLQFNAKKYKNLYDMADLWLPCQVPFVGNGKKYYPFTCMKMAKF